MPKSSHTHSPPHSASSSKHHTSGRESAGKTVELALRKKKNADAQAAFRARRANYIATLEETVTSLEAVVVQLQDSCRESRSENQDLKQENARLTNSLETLRHESREREKYLRALWHARKSNCHDPGFDDFPPPPASFQMPPSQPNTAPSSLAGTPIQTHSNPAPYPTSAHPAHPVSENVDPRVQYQPHDSPGPMQHATTTTYHDGHNAPPYANRSPSLPFVNNEGDPVNTGGRPLDPRMQKIGQYPVFSMQPGTTREGTWANVSQAGTSTASPQAVAAHENGSTVHSPAYMPSPHATANELAYAPRYSAMDAQKQSLDSVPYILSTSERSISPVVSSPHNSSSTSVNSQFQFVFPAESPERSGEVDYQRHYGPTAPEMTLHGGTADVSSYASAFNRQRSSTGPERPMLGAPAPPGVNEQPHRPQPPQRPPQPQQMNNSSPSTSKDAGTPGPRITRRSLRLSEQAGSVSQASQASPTPSRSPSPTGHHPISSTLAVIKAQAFGALRRTRARPKKTEHASKVAMEVLEARGIGIGLGLTTGSSNKRPRLHNSEST